MNARERWNRIMQYRKIDKLPVLALETYYEEITLRNWYQQGLPEGMCPEDHLGMDRIVNVPLNLMPIPAFERKVLYEDDECFIETGELGNTIKRKKDAPNMFYGHLNYPVKNMDDWKRYRERFNADMKERNSIFSDQEVLNCINSSENPVVLNLFPFFFRLGFYSLGMEGFMVAFYDAPELIHEMFSFWGEFILKVLKPVLGKIKVDVVTLNEDLAYKSGPHISPSIYEEFWLPYQNRIIQELKKSGIERMCMWTSGNIDALLPILMENGINMTWVLDRNSGMDPIRMRKQYGKELRMGGGIPKQVLYEGPYAIDKEIERLMPLIEEGGFVPAMDDVVPPEVPYAHYCYLINRLRSINPG